MFAMPPASGGAGDGTSVAGSGMVFDAGLIQSSPVEL
jgi:hypothetical protein